MDPKALFKIQCGLYVAGVESGGKLNGCISNTLMQQSHAPVKLSCTLQKRNLTHDLIMEKKSLAASILSDQVGVPFVKRFGFVSGREVEKFAENDHKLDVNGNPYLDGPEIAAILMLKVYDTVDVGSHTIFLCTADDMIDREGGAVTYTQYQTSIKNKS